MKSSCNYDTINNLFYQKIALFMILLQFRTILLPLTFMLLRREHTYVSNQHENSHVLMVFSAALSLLVHNSDSLHK